MYAASHPVAVLGVEGLRRIGGTVRVPGLGVVVNDPVTARALLDDERFSKSAPGSAGAVISQVMGEYALLNLDGEAHRALRRRIGDLFGSRYLDTVTAEVLSEPIAQLTAALRPGATVDLVPFVRALTGRMICHQIGITPPPDDEERTYRAMFARGETLVSAMTLSTVRLSEPAAAQAREIWAEFEAQLAQAYASPGHESSVVHILRQQGLSLDEVSGVAGALFLTGTQSVSTALPRIVALLADSGQWQLLRAHPELLQRAVDEGLRLTVPSPVMLRSTLADATVQGRRFRRGDRVVVLTYNLAKDGRLFPHPRRFDITREHPAAGRHLWFGTGHRFCLGFALAQRELRAVLAALLDLPGDLEVTHRRAAHGVLLPAYARLEVRLR